MQGAKVNFKKIPEELRKLIGNTIKIIKGNWKGYLGVLKSVTDKIARVELTSKNKIISLELNAIADTNEGGFNSGSNIRMESGFATPRSGMGGSVMKTPAYYPQSPSFKPNSPGWNPGTRNFIYF